MESKETAAVVSWLRSQGVLFCGTIGGIHASIQAKVRAKREGYQKGVPDLIIYEPRGPYHGLAIEMKSAVGTTSEEQDAWIERLNARGYLAIICRSAAEAIKITEDYLSPEDPARIAAACAACLADRTQPGTAATESRHSTHQT